ncbi:MAG TPA: rhodanese-like domain-containing protein, partial [Candidatus Dormibacteraeota bacterium]|nr:rhodanese-like domain-containing protein [Candidatus Dormibacteraeota bacterium]
MPPATPFREVSAAEALELAASGWRILDVREQVEWNEGHIPSATLLPLADLPSRIAEVAPDRDAPLLVHCAVGARSLRA